MSLQPKTRKYRLSFRNKTRIFNSVSIDTRIRKLKNKSNLKLITKQNNSLYPCFPFFNPSVFPLQRGVAGCGKSCNVIQPSNCQATQLLPEAPFSITTQNLTWPVRLRQGKQGPGSSFLNQKLLVNYSNRVSQIDLIKKGEENAFKINTNGLPNARGSKIKGAKVNLESILINTKIDSGIIAPTQNSSNIRHTSAVIDKVKFGSCGFYFCSSGTISSKFIETIRLIIARKLKKTGRFWIRVCPDTPVTARSAETRMGRGKGAISHYEAKIRPGQMFIEFSGVTQEDIKKIYQQLNKKSSLPISLLF